MRVLIVLVALVATPFLAGVSQDRAGSERGEGHDAEHCAKRAALHPGTDINKCGGVRRSVAAQLGDVGEGHDDEHCAMRAGLHPDKDINKCDAATPPPPPAGAEIHGMVWHDLNGDGIHDAGEPPIPSWFVMLAGTTVPAAQTDGSGSYSFTGLSAGVYTVCAQQRAFDIQTAPSGTQCSGVGGYTITLLGGQVLTGYDFGFFF